MLKKSSLKNSINLTIFILLVISKLNIIHTKPFDENDNSYILLADNNSELNDKDITNKQLDTTYPNLLDQETTQRLLELETTKEQQIFVESTKKEEPNIAVLDTTQQKVDIDLATKADEIKTTKQNEIETTTQAKEIDTTKAQEITKTSDDIATNSVDKTEIEQTSSTKQENPQTTTENIEQETTQTTPEEITETITEDPNVDIGMKFI